MTESIPKGYEFETEYMNQSESEHNCNNCKCLEIYDDGCVDGVQYWDYLCRKHNEWLILNLNGCKDWVKEDD